MIVNSNVDIQGKTPRFRRHARNLNALSPDPVRDRQVRRSSRKRMPAKNHNECVYAYIYSSSSSGTEKCPDTDFLAGRRLRDVHRRTSSDAREKFADGRSYVSESLYSKLELGGREMPGYGFSRGLTVTRRT